MVEPPLANLSWQASDPLGRPILYTVYVNHTGGDPLAGPPVTVNSTLPWWTLEVEAGSTVSWAVKATPVLGPETLLGVAAFTVALGDLDLPQAVLRASNGTAGAPVSVDALVTVAFNGTGSSSVEGGPLEYWFDFGDGRSSGWQDHPWTEHTYLVEGKYNATLVVRTEGGIESDPALVRVEVGPGDKGSDDSVPGPGAVFACIALMAAAMTSALSPRHRTRRHSRGGGGG